MPNFFVSYDLVAAEQNQVRIVQAIRETGQAIRLQRGLWFVKTHRHGDTILDHVTKAKEPGDKLVVIEATSMWGRGNEQAAWDQIIEVW